jgi:hypothetical protein
MILSLGCPSFSACHRAPKRGILARRSGIMELDARSVLCAAESKSGDPSPPNKPGDDKQKNVILEVEKSLKKVC